MCLFVSACVCVCVRACVCVLSSLLLVCTFVYVRTAVWRPTDSALRLLPSQVVVTSAYDSYEKEIVKVLKSETMDEVGVSSVPCFAVALLSIAGCDLFACTRDHARLQFMRS